MVIACLGWGSLIWDPGTLPIGAEWACDGPALPLEFARQSSDGRMTLVIVSNGPSIPTLWTPLVVKSLDEAVEALAKREKVVSRRAIGRFPGHSHDDHVADAVGKWANLKHLSGVVWTSLKPGFCGMRGDVPSLQDVRNYLQMLTPDARERAAEYVSKAPAQIETPYRSVIMSDLGGDCR
jgi:hypothetical protein